MSNVQATSDYDAGIALLQDTFSGIDFGMALMDEDLNFVMFNEKYVGLAFGDGVLPKIGDNAAELAVKQLQTGFYALPEGLSPEAMSAGLIDAVKSCQAEIPLRLRDGRYLVAASKRTPLGGYLLTLMDVTEERNSTFKARDLLFDAVEHLEEGFALYDEDLRFVSCNQNYIDMALFYRGSAYPVGTPLEDGARESFRAGVVALPPEVTEDMMAGDITAWIGGKGEPREFTFKNGKIIRMSARKTALGGYMVTVMDLTEERNSEAKARALVFDAMETLDEGVALWDQDMRFLMCNDQYLKDSLRFKTDRPAAGTRGEDIVREAYRSGTTLIPDGMSEQQWVDLFLDWAGNHAGPIELQFTDGRTVILTSKETELGGVLITSKDVTDSKRMADADAARNRAINDLVESLDEGVALWDADMNFLLCNDRYMEIVFPPDFPPIAVGANAQEVVPKFFEGDRLIVPEGVPGAVLVQGVIDWIADFGPPQEFFFRDGRVMRAAPHRTKLGGYLITVTDVTEERNAEARARDMLHDAFEALDEGMVLCDEDMNYVFSNAAWKRMMFEGFEHNIPAPGDSVAENFIKHVKSGFYAIPEGMSEDDYIGWIMTEMGQHGKNVRYASADGRHFIGSSHRTAFGGALLFVRDVTRAEIAEAELEQQRESAHQSEKLSALGELLAGVAHELNNPLSVVFGYSQMLQGKIDDPTLSERVDLICQSSERAAKIVRTFLAMARQRPTKMEPCAINDVIETALEVSSYSLKSNGTQVTVDLAANDPLVTGDFDQLAQVFSNLIVNAGHAVGDQGGQGRIALRSQTKGKRVIVEITDNGHGIPDDIQKRIFEPFFTTKDVGEGTGIGLAFSHRIIGSHNGQLRVTSKVGKGTTFFVELHADLQPVDTPDDAAPMIASDGRSVLVVDDEEGVARLIADLLGDEGFDVTTSTDPRAALRLAETKAFDMILSDFKMPQMNGETFFRALEAIAPASAKRTGFITGDAMSAEVVRFFTSSGRPHIEKPIIKAELLDLIQRATQGVTQ